MCQMCDEYEAELRRMGIAMDDKISVELDRAAYEELARLAEEHGHTVSEGVRDRVLSSLPQAAPSRVDRPMRDGRVDHLEWSRRIRAMTPKGVQQTDSTQLIREDRDRGHSIDRR